MLRNRYVVTRAWEISQAYEVVQGRSAGSAQESSIDTRTQT